MEDIRRFIMGKNEEKNQNGQVTVFVCIINLLTVHSEAQPVQDIKYVLIHEIKSMMGDKSCSEMES